jgi:predicted PurR-regulated permease PerM
MGVVTYLLADALSIDMPALLAVAAALMAFLPYVGIVLGAVPVALLAVVRSPTESLVILGAAAAVQVVDALVVQPRIHRASFGFGLFPTLVVVALGVSLYGVIGLFVGLSIGALAMAVGQTLGTPDAAADGPDGGEGGPGAAPAPAPAGSAAVADA